MLSRYGADADPPPLSSAGGRNPFVSHIESAEDPAAAAIVQKIVYSADADVHRTRCITKAGQKFLIF